MQNHGAIGERFPGCYFWNWYGLVAPAQTPERIVRCLRTGLVAIAKSPDFVQSLEKLRLSPVDEPQKFNEVIAVEIKQRKWLVEELQLPRI